MMHEAIKRCREMHKTTGCFYNFVIFDDFLNQSVICFEEETLRYDDGILVEWESSFVLPSTNCKWNFFIIVVLCTHNEIFLELLFR